jgi:hypothetical protein
MSLGLAFLTLGPRRHKCLLGGFASGNVSIAFFLCRRLTGRPQIPDMLKSPNGFAAFRFAAKAQTLEGSPLTFPG